MVKTHLQHSVDVFTASAATHAADLPQMGYYTNTSATMNFLTLPNFCLRPAIPGRRFTFFPKQREVQLIPGSTRDFQNHLPAVAYDLGCNIDDFTAQSGCVTNRLDHWRTNILLECLAEKKRHQHGVVKGGIGCETLEWQLFETEILQRTEDQLVAAPTMIGGDNGLRQQHIGTVGFDQRLVDGPAHAQVGVQERIGPGKSQQHLVVFIQRPAEYGPAKPLPAVASAAKLQILPDLTALLIAAPVTGLSGAYIFFDRWIQLAGTNVADVQLLKHLKELLIEKPAVHAHDDRHLDAVMLADFAYNMANHLLHGIAVVAVCIAAAKDRIDHKAFPVHLQWLKAANLLVGGPNPVAHPGLVVVHDHGVNAQNHHRRSLQVKAPQKQALQQMPEQINPRPPKALKKPLHRMGRKHVARRGLYRRGISSIAGQRVEMNQMPAGAVHKKAKQLFEYLADGLSFAAASHGPEKGLQLRNQPDAAKVAHEKTQSPASGQRVGGDLHPVNDNLAFCAGRGRFAHCCLPPFGLQLHGTRSLRQPRYTTYLAH